jgi:hypothetical protein
MCNQRERLIGFVYGEGEAADLAEVQQHLDGCADCRAEIAGLRQVREDLLAWAVPDHESVWRPFVAAPVVPWWKQVPSWAMALAAGVMLVVGAAGGAAVQAVAPARPVIQTADSVPAPPAVGLTADDLTAAEQRLLARLEREVGAMGARVEQASLTRTQSVQLLEGDHSALADEVMRLRQQNRAWLDALKTIDERLDKIQRAGEDRNASLEQKITDLRSIVTSQLQLR